MQFELCSSKCVVNTYNSKSTVVFTALFTVQCSVFTVHCSLFTVSKQGIESNLKCVREWVQKQEILKQRKQFQNVKPLGECGNRGQDTRGWREEGVEDDSVGQWGVCSLGSGGCDSVGQCECGVRAVEGLIMWGSVRCGSVGQWGVESGECVMMMGSALLREGHTQDKVRHYLLPRWGQTCPLPTQLLLTLSTQIYQH